MCRATVGAVAGSEEEKPIAKAVKISIEIERVQKFGLKLEELL